MWCNVQDDTTVLHYAVEEGHKEVVEMLLGAGADANAADEVHAATGGYAWVGVGVYGVLLVDVLSPLAVLW